MLGYATSCASKLGVQGTSYAKICEVQIVTKPRIVKECLKDVKVIVVRKGGPHPQLLKRDPFHQMSAKKTTCKGPVIFVATIFRLGQ